MPTAEFAWEMKFARPPGCSDGEKTSSVGQRRNPVGGHWHGQKNR